MPHCVDVECTWRGLCEAHAVITDSKPMFWVRRFQLLNVAGSSFSEPTKRLENTHCSLLVYATDVSASALTIRSSSRTLLSTGSVLGRFGSTKVRNYFFVRNASAAVLLEPFL